MDTLETLLSTALPPDISSAPLAEETDGERSVEDVVDQIDHSIYAALGAS